MRKEPPTGKLRRVVGEQNNERMRERKEVVEMGTSYSEALAVRNINVERKSLFAANANPSENENHSNAR